MLLNSGRHKRITSGIREISPSRIRSTFLGISAANVCSHSASSDLCADQDRRRREIDIGIIEGNRVCRREHRKIDRFRLVEHHPAVAAS